MYEVGRVQKMPSGIWISWSSGVKSSGNLFLMHASSVPRELLSKSHEQIVDTRMYREMRLLFSHIRAVIEGRYSVQHDQHKDLPWQGVSAFLFLRFFVPAILNPHLFGFWPGKSYIAAFFPIFMNPN